MKVPSKKFFVVLAFAQHFMSMLRLHWAVIAQWIRLRLPNCCPRFESQGHHLHFFQFIKFTLCICNLNWNLKRTKINKKRPGLALFKKGITVRLTSYLFCLDSAALLLLNEKQFYLLGQTQTSQTGGQPYSDTATGQKDFWLSPCWLCSCS